MIRRHSLPAQVYALVERTPATVLLEGGTQNDGGPPNRSKTKEKTRTQLFLSPLRQLTAHTSAEVPSLFRDIENAIAAGHFAAGFFTYECGNCFEPKAATYPSRADQPLAWFGIYERGYAFDHSTGAFVGGTPPELTDLLAKTRTEDSSLPPEPPPKLTAGFALTESDYSRHIAAIHEWIRSGDVYQLNFTAPFRIKFEGGAPGSIAAHYVRLRARQPVDYGAFLHWQPGRHILSFSPELFFRVDKVGESRRIVTRPMKGTAARGRTTKEDLEISAWLQSDPKNRGENVMIVDLLRNDLGRIARFGSVHTENLFAVERHPTLWQMTSTVIADLRPGVGCYDIFRALFPSGSVTGAPKVRAMQLIAELEDAPRGVYTGAIGFFSPQQTVFNVAIRTLELAEGEGTFGTGSGIVIDSMPEEEFRECLLKAQFLTGPAHRTRERMIAGQPDELSLIETMLWNGVTYPLLDLHLDRLTDSADYFDFACDRAAIHAALKQHAHQFAEQSPRKVRLLLIDRDGNFSISSEPLAPIDPARIGLVSISPDRTDPADPTLYHKTTQRARYALAFQEASHKGFDDVLFLNPRCEVTEGAISNLFIEKDGRWFTPPIECGLLAGVYRRQLLEARPEIEERVLTLEDLRTADTIYITNAVRGLRRVQIDWNAAST
jgi:para-aminobenzoate synthetase/4-amino-4-deoxychorismate lyase